MFSFKDLTSEKYMIVFASTAFCLLISAGAGVGGGVGAVPCVYLNGIHAPMTSSDEFQVSQSAKRCDGTHRIKTESPIPCTVLELFYY